MMTFEEWKQSCIWCISPQQLAVDPDVFTESIAKVSTIGITANIAGASRLAKRRKLLALGQARLHEGSPQRVALGVEV